MKIKTILACGTAATLLAISSADAATINLVDLGGVTGSVAEKDFKIAAKYWGTMLTNNATINLGVGFSALPPNVIGSTGSRRADISVAQWESLVNATKSNSALDQQVVLPSIGPNGAISYITAGTDASGGNSNASADQVYADDSKYAGAVLYANSSLIKAIGGSLSSPGALDGSVKFSSDFAFDFNATDGISAGHMDFLGVAIHEIGHALGFVSGVDYFDYYGSPNGPGAGALGYDLNDTSIFSALDMFRYSDDPNDLGPGGPQIDLTTGTDSYFSIDGGQTALFGNSFSTGTYNGDGHQASHWKDASGANACGPQLGIMDPTFCYAQMGEVTSLDLAAYDAMGWNLSVDALANNGGYHRTTAQIYASLAPEPGTWALMLGGFGAVGFSLRRRRTTVSFG
jgi:hypothetical protein